MESIEDEYSKSQTLKVRVHFLAQLSKSLRNFRDDSLDFVNDRNLNEVDEVDKVAEISNSLSFKSMRISQDLPSISWVDEFIWLGFFLFQEVRDIHNAALRRLAFKFHCLIYFEAHISEDSIQIRSDMTQEMSNLSLPRLSELVFSFAVHYEFDRLSNISSHFSDAFFMIVHRFLQFFNLLKMILDDLNLERCIRFTFELFWPQLKKFEGEQKSFWSCLQSIIIMISSISSNETSFHICEHLIDEFESARLNMNKVNSLFMTAARVVQHMPKLSEMKLRMKAHKDMNYRFCEMTFVAQGYCSEEDIKGEHVVLRFDRFIFSDSRKLVLLSN